MKGKWPNEKIHDAIFSRPYQINGAKFIARSVDVLLADQPGLGKTIQTLAGVTVKRDWERPRRILVLTPSVAVSNVWGPEIRSWLGDSATVVEVQGTRLKRERALFPALEQEIDRDQYIICNLEMVRIKGRRNEVDTLQFRAEDAVWPELFRIVWDTIVVDESQRALIKKGGEPTQIRSGMMKLRAHNKVALSGTPMFGKPEQLWGTLNWLRPYEYPSYWKWVKANFDMFSDRYSQFIIGPLTNPDATAKSLEGIMLRRTKLEVADWLPPKTYAGTHLFEGDDESPIGIWLDLTPRQKALYERLNREGILGANLIANGQLAEDQRRRLICASELMATDLLEDRIVHKLPSPKFEWLIAKLEELGIEPEVQGNGAKIIVASQFTQVLDFYERQLAALGFATYKLTGKTSDKVRSANIRGFQSEVSTAQIFLINMKAGGVAVTLDAADDLVMLDETYIPDESEQMEDRCHRVSRLHNVTIHYLRMRGTIEEEIALVNAARYDVQAYLLDGSRGIDTARRIYAETRSNKSLAESESASTVG